MSFGRILLYGMMYWFVGIIITFVKVQQEITPTMGKITFYATIVVLPLIFFGIFFKRMIERTSWKTGLYVGVAWIVLFIILDALVLLRAFGVAASTYFSLNLLLDYVVLLAIGMGIAELVGRARRGGGPEGLA